MSDNFKKTFANNLNYWMDKRGKTQADLYREIGVSSATASDWCNAKKIPRVNKLIRLAEWLNVDLGDLMRNNGQIDIKLKDISFRLYNDLEFRNIVFDIASLNENDFNRVKDYVQLLKK